MHFTPSTSKEKNENKENLELAENIYSIRKAEYLQGKFKIQDKSKSKQCSLALGLILKISLFFLVQLNKNQLIFKTENYTSKGIKTTQKHNIHP